LWSLSWSSIDFSDDRFGCHLVDLGVTWYYVSAVTDHDLGVVAAFGEVHLQALCLGDLRLADSASKSFGKELGCGVLNVLHGSLLLLLYEPSHLSLSRNNESPVTGESK
jgi:hypothetical protein